MVLSTVYPLLIHLTEPEANANSTCPSGGTGKTLKFFCSGNRPSYMILSFGESRESMNILPLLNASSLNAACVIV